MSEITSLAEADDPELFGPKAVQLGTAMRAGLPVPDGLALSYRAVADIGSGQVGAADHMLEVLQWTCFGPTHWAVRSSAVGEDSPQASFAGVHLSVLGVSGTAGITQAVREVHASGADAGAAAYRDRLGLAVEARMAVIVQRLIDSDVAGVMFTRNPVTGAAERVIEASWGLGESVVAGLVTPDRYVLDPTGALREQRAGEKDLAIHRLATGGTQEVAVEPELIESLCLSDRDLAGLHELALRCDEVYGSTDHDIEFAIKDGVISLLQRRPITRV